jgi:large subunit ribosomal protein L15
MITLHKLPKITTTKGKRRGHGQGSGLGKNAGRGDKGQVKRAGKMPVGFEGTAASLMKRTPKFKGFKARDNFKKAVSLTLGRVCEYFDNDEIVTLETLKTKGLVDSKVKSVRIVKTGEYSKKLKFEDETQVYLTKGVKEVIN